MTLKSPLAQAENMKTLGPIKFVSIISTLLISLAVLSGCTPKNSVPIAGFSPSETSTSGKTGPVELPPIALGKFTGSMILNEETRSNVIADVSRVGTKVKITFNVNPPFSLPVPVIQDYLFELQPGSQIGVYQSIAEAPSQRGIVISEYRTNMNIVDLTISGIKISYTGTK